MDLGVRVFHSSRFTNMKEQRQFIRVVLAQDLCKLDRGLQLVQQGLDQLSAVPSCPK